MHLAVCIDMHFETPSVLRPLLTNFAVAVHASNLACTPLSRYEYFYIGITIVNFISIYQYITHITNTTTIKLYVTVVRSQLLYCTQVWQPHFMKDIVNLERI